jgi:phosphoglucomutase
MDIKISPLAGKVAPPEMLVNVAKLVAAYFTGIPDASNPPQAVAFGTSGHRGSAFDLTFNESHVLAITQAICLYRHQHGINGPLYLGMDTHALSEPALVSTLEVLAANNIEVMIAAGSEYTPTPAVSLAILAHNRNRIGKFADGIILTPSHNPPESGGVKYNSANGGPASSAVTSWIEREANNLLADKLKNVKRMPYARALKVSTTHKFDYLNAYVRELGSVINMDVVRDSGLRMGVDPLGGAGVHYWARIAEHYRLNVSVINDAVDATFRFVSVDWDGQIRMDPASPYAVARLIAERARFDIAFACDTDHDRHGIVTPGAGLLPSNHYLSAAIYYLFQHRPAWAASLSIGKTVVSTIMIDQVAVSFNRKLVEMPAGFKWFVDGLFDASLGFAGEESAGATFLRRDGTVWTTDKDGIAAALLAAEITARTGKNPEELYSELEAKFGALSAARIEVKADAEQRAKLSNIMVDKITQPQLAGDEIISKISLAHGNLAPIGGIKITTDNGWFAARPSGTENLYKIYAESRKGQTHLQQILDEAQLVADSALSSNC